MKSRKKRKAGKAKQERGSKQREGFFIVRVPDFAKRGGELPVIVQEFGTGRVLMLGYTREKEFWETFYCHEVVLYSTSRRRRWKKGETSGHLLLVHEMITDCDGDALLYIVTRKVQDGGACHTGRVSCFFNPIIASEFEKAGNTKMKAVSLC